MNRSTRYLLIAVVAGSAALAGYLTSQRIQPESMPAATVSGDAGEILLALTLPDADGVEHALEQWRGKVLVVNFWATWCPPCIKEIPEFSAVSRRYADAPVQFVGISVDTIENVVPFAEEHKVPYPLLIGTSQHLMQITQLSNSPPAMPLTVILDAQGKARHTKLGTLNEVELEGKIRELLPRQ